MNRIKPALYPGIFSDSQEANMSILEFKFSFHLPDSLISLLSQSSLTSDISLPQVQEVSPKHSYPRNWKLEWKHPERPSTTPFIYFEMKLKQNIEDLGTSALWLNVTHVHVIPSPSSQSLDQFLYSPDFLILPPYTYHLIKSHSHQLTSLHTETRHVCLCFSLSVS